MKSTRPLLSRADWQTRNLRHQERVDALLAGHLARARRGERHPVEDFLFDYYSYRPAQLRRWHPGVGVALLLEGDEVAVPQWRDQRLVELDAERAATLDVPAFLARRGDAVQRIRDLLRATASRSPSLGCFGLHEWAMVYHSGADRRHPRWPLRLGEQGTDDVVEAHRLRCSHFDATRFFTSNALPRNELQPSRETQIDFDQPGCLHATMDLYKWAIKLAPASPSELIVDCFELARDVREVDMRASPYDLSELGYPPIAIETPAGKAGYVEAQRAFADRAEPLRSRLIELCNDLLA